MISYNYLAFVYDLALRRFYKKGLTTLMNKVNNSSSKTVLDVGVGTGLNLPLYRTQKVVAIDPSKKMLKKAKRKKTNANIKFINSTLEKCEINNTFETIILASVLSTVKNKRVFLQKIKTLSTYNTDIFVFGHFTPEKGILRYLDLLVQPIGKILGFNSVFKLKDIINEADLTLKSIEPIYLGGYWSVLHLKNF